MSFVPVSDPVVTIQLTKKIQYLGDEIHEIAIREPTAGDIQKAGIPVKVISYDPFEIKFDETNALRMLSRLTSLPIEGTLERMTAADTVNCFYGFARFFIPGLASNKPDEQPGN